MVGFTTDEIAERYELTNGPRARHGLARKARLNVAVDARVFEEARQRAGKRGLARLAETALRSYLDGPRPVARPADLSSG
jgi:hypothetical protein